MEKIRRIGGKSWDESKKTWHIAGPAILTGVLQSSLGVVTVAFVGHLGGLELAAVTMGQSVVQCFAFGLLLGMGSALETLCGQAVGAGQLNMLGIYMQRSFIITGVTALILTPIYAFASPILKLLHQSKQISELAQRYARWAIPQLFALAVNFPMQKFLQSQSKVWMMAVISAVALAIHALLNWVFVARLGYGLVGAAVVGDISMWFTNSAQMIYIVSGFFPEAWTGFSWKAFESLSAFVKLSLASAVMLWLVFRCKLRAAQGLILRIAVFSCSNLLL